MFGWFWICCSGLWFDVRLDLRLVVLGWLMGWWDYLFAGALWFAGFGALVGLVGGFFCLLLGGLAWFGLVCWLFVCSSCWVSEFVCLGAEFVLFWYFVGRVVVG